MSPGSIPGSVEEEHPPTDVFLAIITTDEIRLTRALYPSRVSAPRVGQRHFLVRRQQRIYPISRRYMRTDRTGKILENTHALTRRGWDKLLVGDGFILPAYLLLHFDPERESS